MNKVGLYTRGVISRERGAGGLHSGANIRRFMVSLLLYDYIGQFFFNYFFTTLPFQGFETNLSILISFPYYMHTEYSGDLHFALSITLYFTLTYQKRKKTPRNEQ